MTTATSAIHAAAPGGMDAELLRKSNDFCRDITRREAKNFYYGLKLLPEPKRSAMYALYAYMRLIDDIADDDTGQRSLAQRKGDLDQWESLTQLSIGKGTVAEIPRGHILWPAFSRMVQTYRVPATVFDDMIAGQRQDLEPVAIANFQSLHDYCYRVASVVGVASLYVFGFEGGEETLKLGAARGIAFQLTNILRDLREDSAAPRRRCYIPQEDLQRFGVTHEQIAAGSDSPAFRALMQFQIERTESFYQKSASLESRIAADSRSTLRAMTGIYHGLLERMRRRPEAVLRRRVRLSTWNKLLIAWRAVRA